MHAFEGQGWRRYGRAYPRLLSACLGQSGRPQEGRERAREPVKEGGGDAEGVAGVSEVVVQVRAPQAPEQGQGCARVVERVVQAVIHQVAKNHARHHRQGRCLRHSVSACPPPLLGRQLQLRLRLFLNLSSLVPGGSRSPRSPAQL